MKFSEIIVTRRDEQRLAANCRSPNMTKNITAYLTDPITPNNRDTPDRFPQVNGVLDARVFCRLQHIQREREGDGASYSATRTT